MEDYAGRVLADRYRLPRPPADAYELVETRAFDTYSGQEVMVRQVLLPEVVTAELPGDEAGFAGDESLGDSARRALAAARAAAAIPDHPRLVQVFDIFVEDGSLWIASELVSGRPLAALLAERPLDAYRAAEVGADILTALRALHAHGWTHRNVTAGTVLVLDDGRAMLTGLAAGAAQEALCGYDPLPEQVLAGGSEAGADTGAEAGGGAEPPWHGPRSALEQERARRSRMTVVGAVTERWAPEQAHEVHENWRLSPPVGPAADLWALGALLFRSVQGHPPYPEESAAELAQLVCAEPPAYAEECGPLRPVVESLLRPDPEERPDSEEVGGWLRSLIRSAPEPDLGTPTVQVPADPARLPVKRRKGELVRRRHARGKQARPAKAPRAPRAGRDRAARAEIAGQEAFRQEDLARDQVVQRRPGPGAAAARRLGVRLLFAVLAVLAAAVLYAVLVMPHRGTTTDGANADRTVPARMPGSGGGAPATTATPAPTPAPTTTKPAPPSPRTSAPQPPDLGGDFTLRTDSGGFVLAVHDGWQRTGRTAQDQIHYAGGDLQLTVVPGRDTAADHGTDPLAYQLGEPELAPFRASSWSAASGLRTLDLRGHPAAEGEYSWRDANGRQTYARNLAVLIDGRYHVLLVTGPDDQRAAVQRAFDKAVDTYTPGGAP